MPDIAESNTEGEGGGTFGFQPGNRTVKNEVECDLGPNLRNGRQHEEQKDNRSGARNVAFSQHS